MCLVLCNSCLPSFAINNCVDVLPLIDQADSGSLCVVSISLGLLYCEVFSSLVVILVSDLHMFAKNHVVEVVLVELYGCVV